MSETSGKRSGAIDIQLYGDPSKKEYAAAAALRGMFQHDISQGESAEIRLYSGAKLFGQPYRDVDIILVARFPEGLVRRVSWMSNRQQEVRFHSIVTAIEVKDHDARDVEFEELSGAWVPYNGKLHNATEQSEGQKYSTINYLQDRFGWAPHVCNLLWFRNLAASELPPFRNNFLAGSFRLADLLEKCCISGNSRCLYPRNHLPVKWAFYSCKEARAEEISGGERKLFDLYDKTKASLGLLTRQKLEHITRKKLLTDQKYAEAIGKKLVVFRGRAGTGKTIKLLHIAYDLCVHHGKRVLVLTYNKLLVSDLERTLALADISSDIDTSSIQVNTIHKFIRGLLKHSGIAFDAEKFIEEAEYARSKACLLEYLREGLLTSDDISSLKKQSVREFGWDSVLVDEGQDWPQDEREILFFLFGSENVVVACGSGQLVRSAQNIDWTLGVEHNKPIGERRSLRQKRNLCDFEDAYAEEFGVNWDLEPNAELPGGRILIVKGDYSQELHDDLMRKCVQDGNGAYEHLFLVPPSLTVISDDTSHLRGGQEKQFSMSGIFNQWGIRFWDGVKRSSRTEYPIDPAEHRIVTYDSARGLEGWVVVCMELDKFVEYKRSCPYLEKEGQQLSLGLSTPKERIEALVHQWVLIALTRAIDSTVITLANPETEFSKRLLGVSCPMQRLCDYSG